jgi:HSP20 family molecular chaperone IbpA
MAEKNKAMEVQKQEELQIEGTERMRARATFIPRSDIYETEEHVVVTVDVPGVNENDIDITMEKNILTINAMSSHGAPEGYSLSFAEFQAGDYERSFRLTDQIDRDRIEAVYADGVLKLTLPKAEKAKAKKISVKTG